MPTRRISRFAVPWLAALLLILLAAVPALAGGNSASASTCNKKITAKCYVCAYGTFLEQFEQQASYDSATRSCVTNTMRNDARSRCAANFSYNKGEISVKWEYYTGTKHYSELYPPPPHCKHP